MTDETSPGGSRMYRHTSIAPSTGQIAHADDERIGNRLNELLGGEAMVWHEIISDRVHLDVHCHFATEDRPRTVLVTSGMSAMPMTVPAGFEEFQYAELCIALDPAWPLSEESFRDDRAYWPVRLLKQLARLPHDFGTWIGHGHSIPNGESAKPYAPGCRFTGAIIGPPLVLARDEDDGDASTIPGDPPIHFWQVLPVTSEEMDFKLNQGADALIERLFTKDPERFLGLPFGAPMAKKSWWSKITGR